MPDKFTVCDVETLPAPELLLSVIVKDPLRLPVTVGLKLTLMLHAADAATLLPQVLVAEKSPEGAPTVTFIATEPVFVRVMFWPALLTPTSPLANVRVPDEAVAERTPPVPVKLMVCVVGLALSVMVTTPLRVPLAVGLKVTEMVQDPFGAIALAQVFVAAKSPLAVIELTVRFAFPAFVRVTVWALLVVACI